MKNEYLEEKVKEWLEKSGADDVEQFMEIPHPYLEKVEKDITGEAMQHVVLKTVSEDCVRDAPLSVVLPKYFGYLWPNKQDLELLMTLTFTYLDALILSHEEFKPYAQTLCPMVFTQFLDIIIHERLRIGLGTLTEDRYTEDMRRRYPTLIEDGRNFFSENINELLNDAFDNVPELMFLLNFKPYTKADGDLRIGPKMSKKDFKETPGVDDLFGLATYKFSLTHYYDRYRSLSIADQQQVIFYIFFQMMVNYSIAFGVDLNE